jgi:ribosomal protein S18 acetylase RimI-like enzyme
MYVFSPIVVWNKTLVWHLEIDNFIVHPEHRKKGIGKMLTDYVDAKAKELGYHDCFRRFY